MTNPLFYTYDIKWWVSDNENVIDFVHETHYVTRAIFQLETRITSFTVDAPRNINTERRKRNIWHEKIVTSTYCEVSESELTRKLWLLFTVSAHLIENKSTPKPECRK